MQRCVSMVTLNPDKLTMKTNHHTDPSTLGSEPPEVSVPSNQVT